ncbi:MAG: potassium-transporting ATPase subunit KdpC [Chloroflexota bacterium]
MLRAFLRELRPAVVALAALTLITGILYPLAVTAVAQVAMPGQANGSLVTDGGRVVGSALIGQAFSDPGHLWGRPSAAGAGAGYDANASSGSNLAPTSHVLIERVTAELARQQTVNGPGPVPVELLTASGSGLDPHLSPEAARYQAPRIAAARGLPVDRVLAIIDAHTEAPLLGLLGRPRVNVLAVNLALDGVAP